ncbi:F-box only protein 30-like [Ptychodera flava]|uniref:F-box only protein 30-like n=1 Tax=Ptychodera flava TaxID=63121 RepID=UPI003969FCD4
MEAFTDLPHSHCDSCVKLRCNVKPAENFACVMVPCEYECGTRFHSCKLEEHKLWCPNKKVNCINAVYGCPLMITRSQLAKHLSVCPASVIHCTMEWNRWPVCSSERQSHVPFKQSNPIIVPEQLDIALALRDQRMLNESLKASKQIRKALKNTLTQRYPPVPIMHHSHEHVGDGDAYSKGPAGLQSSICNELYKATQRTTETLSAALNIVTNGNSHAHISSGAGASANGDFYSAGNGNEIDGNYTMSAENIFGSEKWKENVILRTEPPPQGLISSVGLRHVTVEPKPKPAHSYLAVGPQDLNIECAHCRKWRAKLAAIPDPPHVIEARKKAEAEKREAMERGKLTEEKSTADHCHADNAMCNHDHSDTKEAHLHEHRTPSNTTDHLAEEPSNSETNKSRETPCSDSSSDLDTPIFATDSVVSDVSAAPAGDHSNTIVANPPPSFTEPPVPPLPPLSLNETLGLDLTMEAITRYQPKPKSMYTFLCAQEFRRDEFPHHFQNVHSEIHGGLNGWIEQRCPLAIYGCTFSQRRLYPGCKGAHVVHDKTLASFGIKPDQPSSVKVDCPYAGTTAPHEKTAGDRASSGNTDEQTSAKKSMDLVSSLPFELLLHIAKYLDSFSLCNLSMTSRLMREVCCALLEERGIVIQHWRRRKYGEVYSWQIAYQVWQFSTSFSPVNTWGFDDFPAIAEHLNTCPFNKRLVRTKPFRVISMKLLEPIQDSVSEAES